MKKILVYLFAVLLCISQVNATFESDAIYRFTHSPSYADLEKIQNPVLRFCEETYLDAYRRRDFTEVENQICGDIFAQKMEDEMIYMKTVLGERGIY